MFILEAIIFGFVLEPISMSWLDYTCGYILWDYAGFYIQTLVVFLPEKMLFFR